ncbi:MAG: histidine phosphatase family protein [Corynebacteriales bacterium]|nr:histidine phosphatase family protein [Mycobacteriales bacterium]
MTARKVLIWRHGRTQWNADGRIQGQADVALDEIGQAQAKAAARLLAAEKPELIISSDLVRAMDTARALGALLNLPIEEDKRLRERHFGLWQGLTAEEAAEQYPAGYAAWRRGEQPDVDGVETEAALTERLVAAVNDAAQRAEGAICVVTHGGAARRAVVGMLELPQEHAWRVEALGNCRWANLRRGDRGWRLHAYNVGVAREDIPNVDAEPSSAAKAS